MTDGSRQLTFDEISASSANGSLSYELERSGRRKRSIQISVEPDLSVRVIAPTRLARARIDEMVRARQAWIQRRREEIRAAGKAVTRHWTSGEQIPFLDEKLELRVRAITGKRLVQAARNGQYLDVTTPADFEGTEAITRVVHKWYALQALRVFHERTALFAAQLDVQPRAVLVRNQQRRWGSCTREGTLRFCWRLILAPQRILDYVVVHELSHILHPHHQRSFWDYVGSILPNYAELRAELRRNGETYRL